MLNFFNFKQIINMCCETNKTDIKNKYIFSYTFLTIFSLGILYISWVIGIIKLAFSLIVYSLVTYALYILWKKLRKKEYLNYKKYLNLFLYKINSMLILLFIIIGWFWYYQTVLYPAKMPTITISNWKKEVIFQAMVHIWSSDFYDRVRNNIIESKNRGFVYFFEWVKPWKAKSIEEFNNAIWIEFDKDLYKNFSKIYGVLYQDNSHFLWLWEKNCNLNYCDFNVDLNMDEIIINYREKIKSDKKILGNSGKIPININKEILNTLSKLNDRELKILVFINKSILNFIIKSDKLQELITDNFANKKLFDVILNKRNEVVANEVISSKYNKIFTTYWLLHFKWIFELLKKDDPNWKIVKEDYLYPIK